MKRIINHGDMTVTYEGGEEVVNVRLDFVIVAEQEEELVEELNKLVNRFAI